MASYSSNRPGTIRCAAIGALISCFGIFMIKPFLTFMVWSGTLLEGLLK